MPQQHDIRVTPADDEIRRLYGGHGRSDDRRVEAGGAASFGMAATMTALLRPTADPWI